MEYAMTGLPRVYAQEETGTETGEQGETEEHNPILPEADELIFGSLAFLIVFVVLARYAFPRINQGLKERTGKIQGDLEKAEQSRADAEELLRRYEQQLQEARAQAGTIIEEARKTAESMRGDLLGRAEEEARQLVARAQEEIRAERDRAFADLRAHVGELSVELASRVVGE
ncbi:MAG TPA: F0F1 ATP synthase subunit B, partial [Actinomycetota bacterium]|nr:F0F1 ATP synthase subunit B [Actinomycetota bacterium]